MPPRARPNSLQQVRVAHRVWEGVKKNSEIQMHILTILEVVRAPPAATEEPTAAPTVAGGKVNRAFKWMFALKQISFFLGILLYVTQQPVRSVRNMHDFVVMALRTVCLSINENVNKICI